MKMDLFIQNKLCLKVLKWDANAVPLEGWEFAMQIGEKYPNGFLFVPEILVNYHQRFGGDGLVSNTKYSTWADRFEYIYNKHKTDKMLKSQDWYPAKVVEYRKLQNDFDQGVVPDPSLRYFVDK
jgi:hypothetical protein